MEKFNVLITSGGLNNINNYVSIIDIDNSNVNTILDKERIKTC